ncbi:MAG: phage minor head protein [Bacteroidales bacterium]
MVQFFSGRPQKAGRQGSFRILINSQYAECPVCAGNTPLLRGAGGVSNDTITEALLNIYKKTVDVKSQIEPNLFRETVQSLNLAVDEGFGKVKFGNPDFDFVNELKFNNAVFSAFKVHREQNDIALQLLDDKGNLKSFAQFKKDAAHIPEHYQKWMDTEYNTAVLRARQAANFKKYQRDADLFPNLKWLQSTSIDKREGHVKLYGTIKPVNDPFWQEHYPGNLWNCKCGITNTDEPATGDVADVDYTPAPGLDENPAFSGALFSKNNPYRKNGYLSPKRLDVLANDYAEHHLQTYYKNKLDDYRKSVITPGGLVVNAVNIASGSFKIIPKSVRSINQHNVDWRVKAFTLELHNSVKNWAYIGWSKVKPGTHPEADWFTYYRISIAGKTRYINMIGHKGLKTEVPYAIMDSITKVLNGYPDNIDEYVK